MVTAERIVATLGGPRALKRKHVTLEDLQAQLRTGLPYSALEAVASGFEIGTADLVAVLRVPPRTLARRKREKRLRADESDRLYRLGRIASLAEEILGSRAKATRWLHEPNRALANAIPLRQLDTEVGARQVEDLLLRIAHGVYS
ncbi:MAG: type II RES/Xre toxin-antitoxin system antitoxin [Candidatus Rokuibacteriota bacterium]